MKYLFKYFYKGPDTAIICLSNSENVMEVYTDISVRSIAANRTTCIYEIYALQKQKIGFINLNYTINHM